MHHGSINLKSSSSIQTPSLSLHLSFHIFNYCFCCGRPIHANVDSFGTFFLGSAPGLIPLIGRIFLLCVAKLVIFWNVLKHVIINKQIDQPVIIKFTHLLACFNWFVDSKIAFKVNECCYFDRIISIIFSSLQIIRRKKLDIFKQAHYCHIVVPWAAQALMQKKTDDEILLL